MTWLLVLYLADQLYLPVLNSESSDHTQQNKTVLPTCTLPWTFSPYLADQLGLPVYDPDPQTMPSRPSLSTC